MTDFSIVDQLDEPKLLRLQPRFQFDTNDNPSHIILTYPGYPDLKLEISDKDLKKISFRGFNIQGTAWDLGEKVEKWLQSVYDKNYKLIQILDKWNTSPDEEQDGIFEKNLLHVSENSILLTNLSSYQAILNEIPAFRKEDINIMSFRPNIVIKNAEEFDEFA